MTSKEYEIRRDGLLRQQAPFVVMEKNGLVAEGENYYRIGDVHVEVTSEVQSELDLLIGLKSKQSNGFRNAYGDKAGVIARNWDAFKHAVNIADETTASLAEVQYGKKLLLRHGAPENLAEQLMPYSRLLEMYGAQGLHVPARQAKSDINMYELFNRLTDFASHTTLWEQNDSRSSSLMQDSMEFLMRKRDIRNYYDIFSDGAD